MDIYVFRFGYRAMGMYIPLSRLLFPAFFLPFGIPGQKSGRKSEQMFREMRESGKIGHPDIPAGPRPENHRKGAA